jgi:hypothetical protein
MRAYWMNKFLSVSAILLLISGTYFLYGYTPAQWHIILLAIVILGYAHYFVGFYYQLTSFKRSANICARYRAFVFLTTLSVLGTYVLLTYVGYVAALLIGALYFLVHGLLNEQTLILRQSGFKMPLLPLSAVVVFFIGLLLQAVPDQTFFFDYDLNFTYIPSFLVALYFSQNFFDQMYFTYIFYGTTLGSLAIVALSVWRYQLPKTLAFISGMIILVSMYIVFVGPPAYIYMHLLIVGYHFVTWLLFYCTEMYRRGQSIFQKFILLNVGVVLGLVVLLLLSKKSVLPETVAILFDYRTFVYLTYVHITTSFMNDAWWQSLEARFFA